MYPLHKHTPFPSLYPPSLLSFPFPPPYLLPTYPPPSLAPPPFPPFSLLLPFLPSISHPSPLLLVPSFPEIQQGVCGSAVIQQGVCGSAVIQQEVCGSAVIQQGVCGSAVSSPAGSEAQPQPKLNLMQLKCEIWHQVKAIFIVTHEKSLTIFGANHALRINMLTLWNKINTCYHYYRAQSPSVSPSRCGTVFKRMHMSWSFFPPSASF